MSGNIHHCFQHILITNTFISYGFNQLFSHLEHGSGAVKSLALSGGQFFFLLDLDGRENLGVTISPELLGRLAALGFCFGIEVFPNAANE